MCLSEMMAIDAKGGLGHEGLNNTLPLAYDKYARRGTAFGPEPTFVAGTCTPDAPQGQTDGRDQGAARHRAAARRRPEAADLRAAEVLVLLPRTTSEVRLLKRSPHVS